MQNSMKRIVLNIGMNVGNRKDATNVALALRELTRQWIGQVFGLKHGVLRYADADQEATFIIEFDTPVEYDPVPRVAIMARVLKQNCIAVVDGDFEAVVYADGTFTTAGFDKSLFFTLQGARMYGAPQAPASTGGGKPKAALDIETRTTFDFELWLSQLPTSHAAELKEIRKTLDKLTGDRKRGDTSLMQLLTQLADSHNGLVDRVKALDDQIKALPKPRTGWMAGAGSAAPIKDEGKLTVTLTREEWAAVRGGLQVARNYAPERGAGVKKNWMNVQSRIAEQTIGE